MKGGLALIKTIILSLIIVGIIGFSLYKAYDIRLYPVKIYGRIIHEFDPWFHFSATRYLAENGLDKFFHWFDHQTWYPIGRPVGTTIYPGMQMTAVVIWRFLKQPFWRDTFGFSPEMTLNDVCVFIPAWFGSLASLALGLLAHEVTGSWFASSVSTWCMAIIPAHLMRSAAGEFDNECIAMFAMCLTFYLWCRSLRTPKSWWIGAFAGLAYAYMAAAWGGFIYVSNMVALHAGFLILLGHRTPSLRRAFSLYYIVGTALATQIPVVGMTPFKSMEQAAALCVFIGLYALSFCDFLDKKLRNETRKQRIKTRAWLVAAGLVGLFVLEQLGFLAPFSIRVKSLFIQHTKTGNPLVDSVAEHQPASADAYWTYLIYLYPLFLVGFIILLFKGVLNTPEKNEAHWGFNVNKYFGLLFGATAYFFSLKMNRLILLMGPVAALLGGFAVACAITWIYNQLFNITAIFDDDKKENKKAVEAEKLEEKPIAKKSGKSRVSKPSRNANANSNAKKAVVNNSNKDDKLSQALEKYQLQALIPVWNSVKTFYYSKTGIFVRLVIAGVLLVTLVRIGILFYNRCDMHAQYSSSPQIMMKARLQDGKEVMIRDYYDSYMWLRENTPEDSRVLAWWDYGYHISGIANRTSLADGNTWNLEHIATVGRMLASPEEKAYKLTRMMADYVLIWAGKSADDLAKSPHISRIASSVYDGICDNDPMCFTFGFNKDGTPTKTMAASMLYKMHENNRRPGVHINPEWFQEVYTSEYGLVRIYKVLNVDLEAKKWAMDPKNWKCDRPGSWYCPGQYPPGFPKPPPTHKDINYHKLNVDVSRM